MDLSFDEDLEKLFNKGIGIRYKRGEVIIRAGDEPQGVYFLKKGYVKLYTISPDGRELTFNIFKPQSFFPIAWVLGGAMNSYYFEALTAVVTYRLPKLEVAKFLKKNPESMEILTKRISSGLNGLVKIMEVLFLGSARNRVAFILITLANRFGKESVAKRIKIKLPVTHQLISSLAGLARETVSIEMQKLRVEKVIVYSRQSLEIIDIGTLQKVSQVEGEMKGDLPM